MKPYNLAIKWMVLQDVECYAHGVDVAFLIVDLLTLDVVEDLWSHKSFHYCECFTLESRTLKLCEFFGRRRWPDQNQ